MDDTHISLSSSLDSHQGIYYSLLSNLLIELLIVITGYIPFYLDSSHHISLLSLLSNILMMSMGIIQYSHSIFNGILSNIP